MVVLTIVGVAIILVIFHDFVWTTFSASSNGFITTWSTAGVLKLAGLLYKTLPLARKHLHSFAEFTIVWILCIWYIGTWLGWTLIFYSSIPIIETSTASDLDGVAPTGFGQVVYYTGMMFFTLGLGDYAAASEGHIIWRILSDVCAAEGILLSIITVTYLLATVNAATTTSIFANMLVCLGGSPTNILVNAWSPRTKSFGNLEDTLITLRDSIAQERQNHILYPVLFTYSFAAREYTYDSAPPRIAALDELLTILLYAVDPAVAPSRFVLTTVRTSLSAYLQTLEAAHIHAREEAPPVPSLDKLRQIGIPLIVTDESWELIVGELSDRRKWLRGMLNNAGQDWLQVTRTPWLESHQDFPVV
ncbi:hypothetical protein DFS34DRAFT_513162 [Phlyctochytrium arcticum]|nr:hypothetical protein DFS34DRAFT_513162 [Phlyctochytrium arcticum]